MFHERSIKNPGKKSWAQNDIVQSVWLHHTAYTNLTSNDNLGPFFHPFLSGWETTTLKKKHPRLKHLKNNNNQPYKTHTTQCFFVPVVFVKKNTSKNNGAT